MQKLAGGMRAAIEKYHMIAPGDRIAVGVSGGKDSVALLAGLCEIRRYFPQPFELVAISLDPCYNNKETDYAKLQSICDENHVEYIIKRTELAHIIFDVRREKNPCSLCSRMRRGALDDLAKEHGCNKVALGHHMDDAAETFLMNLLKGGRIGCFSPVTYMSRKDLTVIRPLILLREREITAAVARLDLPVVKSRCPVDGVTQREHTKRLIAGLEAEYGGVCEKIAGALTKSGVDGW